MGELNDRRTTAAVDRVLRRVAFETVRDCLDRIPDEDLAALALAQDGAGLAAHGITRPLLESVVGDAEDERERQRRIKQAFDLPLARKQRVHKLMEEAKQHDR